MAEKNGAQNPEALNLIMTYDSTIDSIEVRKWSSA